MGRGEREPCAARLASRCHQSLSARQRRDCVCARLAWSRMRCELGSTYITDGGQRPESQRAGRWTVPSGKPTRDGWQQSGLGVIWGGVYVQGWVW